jgi:hypothetical protein
VRIYNYLKISILTGLALVALSNRGNSQTYDTISNWETVSPAWQVWAGGSAIVSNPHKTGINTSEYCIDVITTQDPYDLMLLDLPTAVNFDANPRYSIKFYPPPGGGNVLLKFENSNNTASHEIMMPTVAGEWNNVVFDFSGLDYPDLTRMVVFFDVPGTAAGNHWLIDDVLREIPAPYNLQSNLPIVVINTFGVSIPDDPKINAWMGIIDNGAGNMNNLNDPFTNYDGNIGIETRGQSTQMFPKKSYGFETRDAAGDNLDVSLLGMPAENDWILYAPYTDKSMLRNVVTFDMNRKMGRYCTRTVYCELVVNNDYKGVYVLMEKIKKDENRVDIATLKPDDLTGDDVTGGYILSVDKIPSDFEYNIDGWKSNPNPSYPNAMNIIFQHYYPEPDVLASQQRSYIRAFITNAENTLTKTGYADSESGYHKYFDVASFVDFMLINEISKEVDNYRYSTYLYKEKDSDGGKLFAGPAWDFNLGYGNVDYWPMGVDYTGWLFNNVENHAFSIMFWWKRLMEDSYFRNLAKTRWVMLRQGALADERISSVIDSMLVLTEDARVRNYERWPILGQYVWPNYNWQYNTYDDEVAYFSNFLFNRLHWMDGNIQGAILKPWLGIAGESDKITVKLYGDYFSSPVLEKSDFTLNNAPGGMQVQSIEYRSATECILTVSNSIAGYQDIAVTVSEKAINTFEDLTSNKLSTASAGNGLAQNAAIQVYNAENTIHIRSSQPELLPDHVEIRNISGQLLGKYSIEKSAENSLPHQLAPGIYLVVFASKAMYQVQRVVVM